MTTKGQLSACALHLASRIMGIYAQVWDVRARGCQREYESRAPVNCAVLHPNQGELISGGPAPASRHAGHPTATQPHEQDT